MRPKISRIDVDATERARFEVWPEEPNRWVSSARCFAMARTAICCALATFICDSSSVGVAALAVTHAASTAALATASSHLASIFRTTSSQASRVALTASSVAAACCALIRAMSFLFDASVRLRAATRAPSARSASSSCTSANSSTRHSSR